MEGPRSKVIPSSSLVAPSNEQLDPASCGAWKTHFLWGWGDGWLKKGAMWDAFFFAETSRFIFPNELC